MMSIALMDMSVLELFRGRLAQPNYLDIEMQFIAGQGVVEVQGHVIAIDGVDAGITRLTSIISHRELCAFFHRDILRKRVARDAHKGLVIEFAISVGGLDHYILALAHFHSHHFTFQTRDDIAIPNKKLQGILSLR